MRPVKVKATALLKDGFALELAEVGCRRAALSSRGKVCGLGWGTKNEKIGCVVVVVVVVVRGSDGLVLWLKNRRWQYI